ncbi:Glu/Leu/Phe/Val family dehydrogenase [Sphingomonas endolithica]|uniref:Glu/Leu/Phe/Val family dehydrogenase n=1 Tax=Sphingomonas endolithica TaxID=2972485 RepID=UPI0021AF765A|nr:Glu/Leu/Phe/Val dehydrogenase dimerization domain-containing protein [Sphingomonas sp. ZFBP2030]
MVLSTISAPPPEQVLVFDEARDGFDGVIVLHSTALGPAAGGCRLWHYGDRTAMTADACRLAQGMTYKNALAGLPMGGGKAVLQRPSDPALRQAGFSAFGRAVRALDGAYVTAEDVGTSVADMNVVARETHYVAGLPPRAGRVGGDPSPATARGVFLAMQLAVRRRLERELGDCTVAIQGVGHVGAALAAMLHAAGAKLIIADLDSSAAARVAVALGAEIASADAILRCKADVLAPCALGGVLNAHTIGRLSAKVVCGAANNQLADPAAAGMLADRGILYAPDFAVNAGGIINVAAEYFGWSPAAAAERVEQTPMRLNRVFALAEQQGLSTHDAAEALAQQLIVAGSAESRSAA